MKKNFFIVATIMSHLAFAQVPSDSLKGFYNFNENLLDYSGNANHIVSSSGTYTTDRFGQANNAFLLDGINDSFVIPVPEFGPITGDFTISFWYKTNASSIMNLFSSKQFPSDTTNNFEIQLNSHNAFYLEYIKQFWYQTFTYWNGTGYNNNAVAEGAPGFFTKGDWCHFLITRNSDTLQIFRNHSLYILSVDNTYSVSLGDMVDLVFSASPHRFKGAIDDLRLYNKGVNQQEVDQLWFENQPIQFLYPKTTDAFVQNSNPLIYWEYNDSIIGDSIVVEMRINNGIWQTYLPHSQMAYENAFYFDLSPYPIGTIFEFKISDKIDTAIHQLSGAFTISPYDWVSVQDSLPFTSRDGAGLLNFKNKMWLLGGWDPPHHPPNNTHSEVWSSTDGVTWNFEITAPWPARHCSAWLTDSSYMYVIGGDPQSGCLTDVWQSADGINWIQLEDTIPGYAIRNNPNYAYANNKFYLFGGEQCGAAGLSDVWQSSDATTWNQLPDAPWQGRGMQLNSCVDNLGQIWMLGGSNDGDRRSFNEVWKTSDGISWTLVNASAPWGGRYWHTTAWFDNKLWVMSGMATSIEMGDVWYSEDGIIWHELKTTTDNWPAGTRHGLSTTVYNNALWYMCGVITNSAWKIINTTTTTDVVQISKKNDAVTIFPNPANTTLNIKTNSNLSIGNYEIYNLMGMLLSSGSTSESGIQIDISKFSNAIYIIQFLNINQSYKFIKQ